MIVVIAGGHGQIARQLGSLLAADGHEARGLIRNPDHADDLQAIGVTPVVHDLERDDAWGLAEIVTDAHAVVFAAGAGPGSGAERKYTMDRDGAIRLIDACTQAGVGRYVMVSAMGAKPGTPRGEGAFGAYLEAKAAADEALAASDLDYTIVRPGRLTDEPAHELISAAPELEPGSIPRADVALTLRAAIGEPATSRKAFDLVSGPTPIAQALAAL